MTAPDAWVWSEAARHQAEEYVMFVAKGLGEIEVDKANEWLRLVKFQHIREWEATQLVEVEYGARIRMAQARFEIAVAALRRF